MGDADSLVLLEEKIQLTDRVRCSGNVRGNVPGEFVCNNLTQEFERIRSDSVEVVRGNRNMKDAGRDGV
jgi:hypothetical protein